MNIWKRESRPTVLIPFKKFGLTEEGSTICGRYTKCVCEYLWEGCIGDRRGEKEGERGFGEVLEKLPAFDLWWDTFFFLIGRWDWVPMTGTCKVGVSLG